MTEPETKSVEARRWGVRYGPTIGVERDDEPFRFRIRQQLLLLARLAAEPGRSLDRATAAQLLWPDAEPSLARTYLRRSVMELRTAGVPLVSVEDGLSIEGATVESNFDDAAASGALGAEGERLAAGWDSPMAEELRRLVRSRARKLGLVKPVSTPQDGDRFVLALLGEALLTYDPRKAMALVAGHRYDFYTKAPEPDLLRFFHRLCDAVPEPSADKIAVMCVMAGITSIQTFYRAADELYLRAIHDAKALDERTLLARALAMRFGVLSELRDWTGARETVDQAVSVARETGDSTAIAFALAARAGYEVQTGSYDAAAASYDEAIEHAEPGPHRDIARHNLAFVWGVLGGRLKEAPAMVDEPHYEGTHLPGGQAHELFALGIGHRRYADAARGAAGALSFAAEGGMERLVAIGLDNAAIAFAKLGHASEAAAAVRVGTRLRLLLEHRRSPMEHEALRRHVTTGYFGVAPREWETLWRSPDPATTAYRVAARLRLASE